MKPNLLKNAHAGKNQAWGLVSGRIIERPDQKGKELYLSSGEILPCTVLGRVYHAFKKFELNPTETHLFGVWIKSLPPKCNALSRLTVSQVLRPETTFYRDMAKYENHFVIKGKIVAKNFKKKMAKISVTADKSGAKPFFVQLFGVLPRQARIDDFVEIEAQMRQGGKLWIENTVVPPKSRPICKNIKTWK